MKRLSEVEDFTFRCLNPILFSSVTFTCDYVTGLKRFTLQWEFVYYEISQEKMQYLLDIACRTKNNNKMAISGKRLDALQ